MNSIVQLTIVETVSVGGCLRHEDRRVQPVVAKKEIELARHFTVQHDKQDQRKDSRFRTECMRMKILENLCHKLALFQEFKRVFGPRTTNSSPRWRGNRRWSARTLSREAISCWPDGFGREQLESVLHKLKVTTSGAVKRLSTPVQCLKIVTGHVLTEGTMRRCLYEDDGNTR